MVFHVKDSVLVTSRLALHVEPPTARCDSGGEGEKYQQSSLHGDRRMKMDETIGMTMDARLNSGLTDQLSARDLLRDQRDVTEACGGRHICVGAASKPNNDTRSAVSGRQEIMREVVGSRRQSDESIIRCL